jgi:Na+/H+ antiporter NhaD/arsenite permease-like protein
MYTLCMQTHLYCFVLTPSHIFHHRQVSLYSSIYAFLLYLALSMIIILDNVHHLEDFKLFHKLELILLSGAREERFLLSWSIRKMSSDQN